MDLVLLHPGFQRAVRRIAQTSVGLVPQIRSIVPEAVLAGDQAPFTRW